MGKHLATCGIVGSRGRRVGTQYANTPEQARAMRGQPWFRFRNDDAERVCLEAWSLPEPTSGLYFDVADEARPDLGSSGRGHEVLLDCPLAKRERLYIRGADTATLQRFDGTDLFQWFGRCADGYHHPFGRLLKLNEAGRAKLAEAA